MIIHLTGADTYRSSRRLAELRAAFIAKHDPQAYNTVTLDGTTTTTTEIQQALSATGFFAAKRFVVLDRYDPAVVSVTDLNKILQPVTKTTSDVIVVIRDMLGAAAKSAARRRPAGKKTTPKKTIPSTVEFSDEKREEFPQLSAAQAVTWAIKEAQRLGGKIAAPAAERLVALCGDDPWHRATELEKLVLHAGGAPVTVADVEAFVHSDYSSDIFALTDALGQRQTARALELLHRELASGMSEFALVSTLASHIRNLWLVKQAHERGVAPSAIAAETVLHPFVVQKALAQAKLFSVATLSALHHNLLHIDHDLKTSPLDAETLLDMFLIQA